MHFYLTTTEKLKIDIIKNDYLHNMPLTLEIYR